MKQLRVIKKIAMYLMLAIVLLYFLGPVLWLLLSSIQPEDELTAVPPKWIPEKITLDNYYAFFDKNLRDKLHVPGVASEVVSSLLNSTIIAMFVTIISLSIAIPAAYTFARYSSKILSFWYVIILLFRLVPAVAIVIPFYVIMKNMGLLGNFSSVIIAHTTFTLPFIVWVLRGFFCAIPVDIEEAALIDGCTKFGAIIRVVLPVVVPGIIASAVFAFMFSWNEFFFSLILTSASRIKTIPVVSALFASDMLLKHGIMNAEAIVAIIPPIFFALIFSSYLRKGLASGSVVG